MSGGKRNHEDVSDTMALVQAACKVLAITADRSHTSDTVGSRCGQRSELRPSPVPMEQSVM
jgi:hypothetical protein